MIRFGVGLLLAACAVFAGWVTRPMEQSYVDRIGVRDLPVVWVGDSEPAVGQPASGFLDREVILEDGAVLIEGWLKVTALPFYIEVIGSTPMQDATGFTFLRADLPSAEGAQAFWIKLEPDSEVPVPICLVAVLGGGRQRLSTPSCP